MLLQIGGLSVGLLDHVVDIVGTAGTIGFGFWGLRQATKAKEATAEEAERKVQDSREASHASRFDRIDGAIASNFQVLTVRMDKHQDDDTRTFNRLDLTLSKLDGTIGDIDRRTSEHKTAIDGLLNRERDYLRERGSE